MNLNLGLGYTGYFVLGYYLNTIRLDKRQRGLIYFLGALGFLLTLFLQIVVALKAQETSGRYAGYLSMSVLPTALAVFVFFKYSKFCKKESSFILKLSKYTFGIYLVHIFVLEALNLLDLKNSSFNPILSVPIISILVYGISAYLSGIIHRIPILTRNSSFCVSCPNVSQTSRRASATIISLETARLRLLLPRMAIMCSTAS